MKRNQMPRTANSNIYNPLIHGFGYLLDLLSGEYLLVRYRYPNGGTVVFLRSAHVTLIVFFGAMGISNLLDPSRGPEFSMHAFLSQTSDHVPWLGAIFTAVYALLYARFSSQWTYLAGIYNQIKAAQLREKVDPAILAEWQAAFIEDCDDLHLIRKPMFASIANIWLNDNSDHATKVIETFEKYSPGKKPRCDRLRLEVAAVVERIDRIYGVFRATNS